MSDTGSPGVTNNFYAAPVPGDNSCFENFETSNERKERQYDMKEEKSSASGGSGSGDFFSGLLQAGLSFGLAFFTGGSSTLVSGAMGLINANNDKKA